MFIIKQGARYVASAHFTRDSILTITNCSVDYCRYPENGLLFTTKEHAQALRDLLPPLPSCLAAYRVIRAPE